MIQVIRMGWVNLLVIDVNIVALCFMMKSLDMKHVIVKRFLVISKASKKKNRIDIWLLFTKEKT